MICLDSWVWLEFVFGGDAADAAERAIEAANERSTGGIVPATVVAEVSYHIRRRAETGTAVETIATMRSFDHIDIVPITDEIAEYGAALRDKYYERGRCELSYADAIHLAMAAAVSDCETLYTGDPDFEAVDEVEIVIL